MLRISLSALRRRSAAPLAVRSCLRPIRYLLAAGALASVAAAAPQDPTVEFSAASSSGAEGGGALVATLVLSGTSASDVIVPFAGDGSLGSGDYTLDTTSPVTIPAGQLSVDLTLTPVDDSFDELDETRVLTLGTPTGATLGTTQVHTYTLTDDDDAPEVVFVVASQSGLEGGGALTVDAQLSAVSGLDVTVPLSKAGTALDPADYSLSSESIFIAAGQTSATLTITLVDDPADEEDETIVLTMGSPSNATLGADIVHTATVTDDDDPPSVQFTQAGQIAGEDGGPVPVTVTLSVASGKAITVPFTVGGNAADPDDYSLSATSFVIPAGTATLDIDLTPVDDELDEEDETVLFTLATPTNASLGAQVTHTFTIQDADDPPTVDFVLASSSVAEGAGSAQLTLQLSAVSGQDVTVPFTLAGTAIDPDDYGFDASPVIIPAGQTTFDLTLTVVDDSEDEDDETVIVTLGTPTGADLGATIVHTATLADDDDPPTVEFDLAVGSAGEASGTVLVSVVLSESSGLDVTVPFTLAGTATDPDDYGVDASPLVILAGQTSGDITLTLVDDALHEDDETVELILGTPTNATLGAVTVHEQTLLDDDDSPLVDFAIASQSAGESAGSVAVSVLLSAPSGLDVTVPFTLAGTAGNPDDYSVDASPLVIIAGQTSADIIVSPADDVLYEPLETVELTLGTPTGGQLGSTILHVLTLTSDDPPPTIEFTSASQSSSEGVGAATIGLTLSAISGTDVIVPIELGAGTATEGVDFTLDHTQVLISAGNLTGSLTVTALADALDEADETVLVQLGTPIGADLGATTTHTLTLLDDDDPPTVGFQVQFQFVDEAVGVVPVTLQLSAVSGLDVTVPFNHKGTADTGSDYVISGSPIVIPAGQTSVDIVVTVVDDADDEDVERVRVLMDTAALVNASPGAIVTHRIKITDNDGFGMDLDVAGLRPDVQELQFPLVEVGQSNGPQTVVLTNTQHVAISFVSVDLVGVHPEDYQVDYGQPVPVTLEPGESATFDVTFHSGQYGPREARARVRQLPHGAPATFIDLHATGVGQPGDELRMNVGPDEYLDTQLLFWSADYGIVGPSAYITTITDLPGSDDDPLYQVARVGANFGYSFVLPDGEYDVTLHFAEIEQPGAGLRVFDVALEGTPVIQGLDLITTAGWLVPWNTGALRTTVSGGALEIDLSATVGEALLSAIEVRSVPIVDVDQTLVDFGVVDQGFTASSLVNLTNSGLADSKATQLAIVLEGGAKGSGADFYVRIGQVDYPGGVSTVYYTLDLDLPAGVSTQIEVFFAPTEHQENEVRIDLNGDYGSASFDVEGTGGANADWGFMHPVLDHSPSLLVDYDEDGTETVELFGGESHTHEPGQVLAAHEWSQGGVPFSNSIDSSIVVGIGSTQVELTITDDKVPADSATDDLTLELYTPDAVPGIMASYYDGGGDPVFLLDNLPRSTDFMERIPTPQVFDQGGQVGGSPFTGDVLVRWEMRFDAMAAALYDFVALGGVDSRLFIDGQLWSGQSLLAAGPHDVELRFAVGLLSDLPLGIDVTIDGQQASGWDGGLVHDERLVVPVIHEMPTIGTELGGNLISIEGFGFFPKDQVIVHWGAIDLTLVDFLLWSDEVIEFESPPGTGSIQVTVETPNGNSNSRTFVYSPDGPIPIKFDRLDSKQVFLQSPTSAIWHPNGKLYVGSLTGKIYEVEFDENWDSTVTVHDGISGLTNFDLLGMAFSPYDAADPVILYVAHGEHFLNGGGSFAGPSPFTGQVSVLTGPDFDNPVPLITGLPTSNHDHGVNGILFDNNGDLLICVGGNTNAGVKWPTIGDVPASPFSGAILKAHTSRLDFNGVIQYEARSDGSPVDDQVFGIDADSDGSAHIEVYASGFRNSYDLALSTWGLLYCTDNGPNVNYGPASTGPDTDSGIHPQHGDEINLVQPGSYYGHPNRNRDDADPRQSIWRDVSELSDVDYTTPLHVMASSVNGIQEYRAQTFNGQIRGHLLTQKWNANQYLLEMSPDGRSVDSKLQINPLAQGLDVVTGPGGSIVTIDYSSNRLRILEPDDASVVGLTLHDIRPWRTTANGGTPFTIGGEGFVNGQTSVTVDGVPCTVTSVSSRRIQGVFPALAQNNIGSLYDVQVTVAADQVLLPAAVLCLPISPGEMKGFWTAGASMPDSLGEVASGVVGTTMYVFGEGTNKTYAYDLLNDTWSDNLATRPFPGNHHSCEVMNGLVYLIGGLGGGSAGRVQIYDPVGNQWTVGQSMPWSGGSCSTGQIGGLIYACGGIVGSTTVSNLSVYDPVLDDWDQGGNLNLASMLVEVNHAAAVSDGTKLWIFGGRQGGNWPQFGFVTVQCYDPQTDSWDSSSLVQSSLEPMPLGRGGTGRAVLFQGEFYVIGGEGPSSVHAEVQVYDPLTDTWRMETDMPTPRHGMYPIEFQGRIFLVGGGLVAGFSQTDVLEILQLP